MNLDDTETILTVIAAVFAGGAFGFAWWLGEPEKTYGRRVAAMRRGGRWCIAADRGPFGYQIVHFDRSKRSCSKWRHKHRHEYSDTLFLLREGYIDFYNAELMKMSTYWNYLASLMDIVEEAEWQAARAAAHEAQTGIVDTRELAQHPMPIVPASFREKPGETQMLRLDQVEHGVQGIGDDTDRIMVILDGMEQQARELREGLERVRGESESSGGMPLLRGGGDSDAPHRPEGAGRDRREVEPDSGV